jgi:hypothetical protein
MPSIIAMLFEPERLPTNENLLLNNLTEQIKLALLKVIKII